MAQLFKRGKTYHFDFRFRGIRYQGSTYCSNKEKAESWMAAYRTRLAHGLVGLVASNTAPSLRTFLETQFLEHVRQNAKAPNTKRFYEYTVKQLLKFTPFQCLLLDQVNELIIQDYKRSRSLRSLSVSTINGELRTLRKALRFAERCGLIRYGGVSTLPGEKNRTFILDGEMERRYLSLAVYPLREVAILMLDLGLRPEEAVRLCKSDTTEHAVTIRGGKSANAQRSLPQTTRTRTVLELCSALFPDSPFIFPGRPITQHLHPSTVTQMHIALRKKHGLPKEFVLYSLRHTHATRFAESGASPFEIKTRLGHSSVRVSERYIHSTPEHMTLAAKRFEQYAKMLRGESHEEDSLTKKSPISE